MKSIEIPELFARFRLALSRFEKAQAALADYWQTLPETRFFYTDGYDAKRRQHDFARMKAKLIQHTLSFTVLDPGSDSHPSTSEQHAGIVFDTNEQVYLPFNQARAEMGEIMKLASAHTETFAGDSEARVRPIYYRWFYQSGYPYLRSLAVHRQLNLYAHYCPRITVGVWRNCIWHPQSPQALTTLKLKYPEQAHHLEALGEAPPLFRYQSRISCRMILRQDKQPRKSVSVSMPVVYLYPFPPDKLELCHYRWKNDSNHGRPQEGVVEIPFFSNQEAIYLRPLSTG